MLRLLNVLFLLCTITNAAVIVQYFEANWASIAAECTAFLGPAGYTYVQVSPPAESVPGTQWWTSYQPVSYILTSKRGNRAAFQSMVTTCNNAGVKVLVDSIWNHMSNSGTGTGTGGSSFSKYSYPAVPYTNSSFHHCTLTSNGQIQDLTSRAQTQTCELGGLADLATETDDVRAKLAAYANDLLSLGVSGFRLDAAKHIAIADLTNIKSRLSRQPDYITSEVTWQSTDAVQPSEYTSLGNVHEFRYVATVRDAFKNNNLVNLAGIPFSGWLPSASANVFIANHDTERNNGSLTFNDGPLYTMGFAFSLAHPYGTPTILSSFNFSAYDDGGPNNLAATCSGNGGSNGWRCEHRWIQVANMVKFRNTVGTAALAGWTNGTSNQIAFQRGNVGFIAINNEASATWCRNFTVGLPDGRYRDIYYNSAVIQVTGGVASLAVPPKGAVAVYTGSSTSDAATPVSCAATPVVTFSVYAETVNIFVAGSPTELGSWNTDNAVACSAASYPTWTCSVAIAAGTTVEYKYIKKEGTTVTWENRDNRIYTVSSSVTLSDTWST
ncbi:carbohydrate-binding module family 20 protein [Atractiella rhizophila]|nr:carbohydrate-binding module family 20 protein [Atractiella rhizophila]